MNTIHTHARPERRLVATIISSGVDADIYQTIGEGLLAGSGVDPAFGDVVLYLGLQPLRQGSKGSPISLTVAPRFVFPTGTRMRFLGGGDHYFRVVPGGKNYDSPMWRDDAPTDDTLTYLTDDLTAECAAEAFDSPLKLFPEALEHLRTFFERRGWAMSPNNERQAMVPS